MKIVIDANILFSIFIKSGADSQIFFNENFEFLAPEFIFEELTKYTKDILSKTHRSIDEFEEILTHLKEYITFIQDDELIDFVSHAEEITPDPKDMIYFALALKLNCPIWSNDNKLKKQEKVKIYSTSDLLGIID